MSVCIPKPGSDVRAVVSIHVYERPVITELGFRREGVRLQAAKTSQYETLCSQVILNLNLAAQVVG